MKQKNIEELNITESRIKIILKVLLLIVTAMLILAYTTT